MKIAIIDYGMGNLRSVEKAFHHVGAEGAFVTADPAEIAAADRAVLPGDGAFDATIDNLRAQGLGSVIVDFAVSGRPLLGICIGMQAMMTRSEEGRPGAAGLDLIPGEVKRFPSESAGRKLTVPLIGWNVLHPCAAGSRLLQGLDRAAWAYFLHSYYCAPADDAVIAGTSSYGVDYCCVIESGNLFAVQFHPEKSGDAGLRILRNFVSLK